MITDLHLHAGTAHDEKRLKSCWRDIPSDAILNCFRHTGFIHSRTTTCRSRDDADDLLNSNLLTHLSAAHLKPDIRERLHLLHYRGRHVYGSAKRHSPDQRRS